ncbi:hypothetical protein ASG46_06015 [Bacillus sp. Leaf49]|uniref:hypothetical protein n=1 Tax=Bacillus sp. Leaf49 TaxID=1736222 RepID=UPI0006F300B3|nr:hypothetical protein [Bacillus sp. Leaf49]KQU12092.1 hypothetical protein ASG46_06015 [Bacillus sp. Leaf49]
MLKKSIFTFVSLVMVISIMITGKVSAAVSDESKYENAIKEIKKSQESFLKYLKDAAPKNEEEASDIAEEYYSDNKLNDELLGSYYEKKRNLLPGIESGDSFDIGKYIEKNVTSDEFEAHEIGNGIKVVFTDSPTYFITYAGEKKAESGEISTSATSKEYEFIYRAKNMFGLQLFRVYNSAYFVYGGKEPRATQTDAYYKRGQTATWKAENWKKGTKKVSGKAVAYAQGNFTTGFSFGGFDLIMEEWHISNEIHCNNKGKVSFYGNRL